MGVAISTSGEYRKLHHISNLNRAKKFTPIHARKGEVRLLISRCKSVSVSDPSLGEDYQHFKKSLIPTFHFQNSLPRLPIPELEKTGERYLRSQQPLLSDEQYSKTKSYVEKFVKSDGIQCQKTLIAEDKANKHTSYITKPWFDMYLTDRTPLPINYNPFLVFANHPKSEFNSQVIKSANLIISSLRFYNSLRAEILEPEVYHLKPKNNTPFFKKFTAALPRSISWYGAYLFKAFPLDMSQYNTLFNTTRVPLFQQKDRIKHVDGKRHLLVMKGGHFYSVDVLSENGDIVAPDVILGAIQKILSSTETAASYPVGVLTTENRDVWATARSHLESIGNTEVLELIDTALFNLVLDDVTLGPDPVSMTRAFLHGDGTNRWFDKSFSLMVTKDGTASVNFEHSWGDGVAVLRYFNDIHTDMLKHSYVHPDLTPRQDPPVRKLEFNLDEKAREMIRNAQEKYDKTCKSLEVRAMDYRKYGRQMCNSVKMSPDALMQLAFQIAYYQIAGTHVTTYESCSTAAFKHGRTEAVRPCTIETQKVCKALSKASPPSKKELQEMLYKCSKVHSNNIKEAAMGQGFDRHLYALRLKADSLGLKPELFSDPAYAAMNHNIMSTSTLASENLQMGAFGPVVHNGYGISYSLWSDRLGSIVTNYEGQADGAGFIYALEKALDQLQNILKS
ncbi:carnitine O-palmitoyltransferase 2, mitochondrial [Macrosteles quadrilineatus]|uniref:carnitine O-palmitoyltransferase 2, mitochondrial n=1 Tax=Macrosteles quadrilineatus TaxID=74068 RepID=UPI0023E34C8F|nr:carnitine O-palmitoyltransferase 2, mitochondrial [Macrosteles quadrilineatus]